MFSDKSINIHYKSPTSRLLKMNTFNEFELNRLKKFYAEELASRFEQNSRSSLRIKKGGYPAAGARANQWSSESSFSTPPPPPPLPLLPPLPRSFQSSPLSPMQKFRLEDEEELLSASDQSGCAQVVDLKRYQHALSFKKHTFNQHSKPSATNRGRSRGASFARALYDFQAKNDGELALKRGDLVEILELINQNKETSSYWANVEDCQSGLQGLVPLNYLDHSIGCAVAKRDVYNPSQQQQQQQQQSHATPNSRSSSRASQRPMAATSDIHYKQQWSPSPPPPPNSLQQLPLLPMSKGEPIVLLHRLSGHLYEASNTRQAIGLVWSNDVDIIKQPMQQQQVKQQQQQQPQIWTTTDDDADEFTTTDDEELVELDRRQQQVASGGGGGSGGFIVEEARGGNRSSNVPTLPGSTTCCGQQPQQQQLQISCSCCQRENQQSTSYYDKSPTHRPIQYNVQMQAATRPRRSSSSPMISGINQQQQYLDSSCDNNYDFQQSSHNQQQQQQQYSTATIGRHQQRLKRKELQLQQRQLLGYSGLPKLYRARYAYKPKQRDELELVVGDILVVVHECDDGWLIGSSYTNKQMGTFPGNFVEPIN